MKSRTTAKGKAAQSCLPFRGLNKVSQALAPLVGCARFLWWNPPMLVFEGFSVQELLKQIIVLTPFSTADTFYFTCTRFSYRLAGYGKMGMEL